ncbi:MAG: hypothetical protein ACYTGW_19605 [Planctomycetota bacterium]|jgi:hypothetical protein
MHYMHVLFLSAGLSAVALPAQDIVSPPGMANAYGGINNSIPWGSYQSPEQFCQQIHDDLLGQTLKIKGMAFRHSYTSTYGARSYTATLTLGDAATKSTGISGVFTSNWRKGGSKTEVLKGTINFPAFKAYANSPSPFDAPVSFTTPYAYDGKHSLMWEVHISGNSGNSPTHYFERGPGTTHRPGVLGEGCSMSGKSAPLTSSGGTNTSSVAERLTNGPSSGTPIVAIGNASGQWSGANLPVSLAFAGSPECFININVVTYLPATNSSIFAAHYTWSTAIAGLRFRTQWAVNDRGFIRTSNGLDHSIPYLNDATNAWPQTRVWATRFGTTLPTTGTVDANGLVTQFRQ